MSEAADVSCALEVRLRALSLWVPLPCSASLEEGWRAALLDGGGPFHVSKCPDTLKAGPTMG